MVALLNRRTYVVERTAPGAYIDPPAPNAGAWVEGAVTTTSVSGSLQPLSGRDAMLLPEGIRERATAKLYTNPTPVLQTFSIDNQTSGDVLIDEDGERLQVWGIKGYHGALLNHRKYMLVRESNAR